MEISLSFVVIHENEHGTKIDVQAEKIHMDTLLVKDRVIEPAEDFMVRVTHPYDMNSVEVKINNLLIKL